MEVESYVLAAVLVHSAAPVMGVEGSTVGAVVTDESANESGGCGL